MQNKEKFNILSKHFVKPIIDLNEKYSHSALTIEAGIVSPKVSKAFQALADALITQLYNYKK